MKTQLLILFILIVSCNMEREVNLGDGYYLLGDYNNSVISKEVKGKGGVYNDILLGRIEKYKYNKSFVIVKRTINEDVKILLESHPLWESQSGSETQYWIINKSTDSLLGPFTFQEFNSFREQKSIDLILED